MAKVGKISWGKWGTWEEMNSFLGKEISTSFGVDEVTKGDIRKWLEPKEFDCPLHYDEATAQKAGYKGIVAPCTMVIPYGVEPYWRPGDGHDQPGDPPRVIPLPVLDIVPGPYTLSFASDIEMEFHAPLYAGDRVTCTSRLVSITPKKLRVGKGVFLRQESIYRNQKDERIAVLYITIFRFAPIQADEE
jgi:hypothetical protein